MDLPALLITVQAGTLLAGQQSEQLTADINDAITAGATAVLLDGSDNAAALYEAAVKVKELLRERAALLLLDRLDIAAAVGAEGVVLSPTGAHASTWHPGGGSLPEGAMQCGAALVLSVWQIDTFNGPKSAACVDVQSAATV